MRTIVAALCGLVFGTGLAISGMIDPAKVLGFLDIAGNWDPSLALVMGAALAVSAPAFALQRRLRRPIMAEQFDVPMNTAIDARLLAGAAIFGVGWGLAGFCPGPALAALPSALPHVLLFVGSMLAGMVLFRLIAALRGASVPRGLQNVDA